jgi:hypothetical protein
MAQAAIVVMLVGGCASTTGAVRQRFVNEFECPDPQVTVTALGSGAYRARGCGQQARYVASCAMYCRVIREDN